MANASYDFSLDDVLVSISGPGVDIDVIGKGSISAESMSADWESEAGASGDVTHSRNLDPRVRIQLSVDAGSPTNIQLNAARLALLASGAGVLTITVKDNNGGTLTAAINCRITGNPGREYGQSPGPVSWEFVGIGGTSHGGLKQHG